MRVGVGGLITLYLAILYTVDILLYTCRRVATARGSFNTGTSPHPVTHPLTPSLTPSFTPSLTHSSPFLRYRQQEGHNCERFRALYADVPRVRTPSIYWQNTSR